MNFAICEQWQYGYRLVDLRSIAAHRPDTDQDDTTGTITMMTVHAAKGLEFHVYIVGWKKTFSRQFSAKMNENSKKNDGRFMLPHTGKTANISYANRASAMDKHNSANQAAFYMKLTTPSTFPKSKEDIRKRDFLPSQRQTIRLSANLKPFK